MHGFCEKIAFFPSIVFYVEWIRVGLERKWSIFQTKTSIYKSRKIIIFPKGVVHGFWQKMDIFPSFVYMQNGPVREKVFGEVLERKWSPLG